MWEDVLQAQSNGQSVSPLSRSPLFFLSAALTVQRAQQRRDQSSMVGNQKAMLEQVPAKGHTLGVELQTGNGTDVFTVQYSYFYTTLSIPDVDLLSQS